jgi:hypothetical protein
VEARIALGGDHSCPPHTLLRLAACPQKATAGGQTRNAAGPVRKDGIILRPADGLRQGQTARGRSVRAETPGPGPKFGGSVLNAAPASVRAAEARRIAGTVGVATAG